MITTLTILALASIPQADASEEEGTLFGRALIAIPDQDGNGLRDFVVTAPWSSREPYMAGTVYLFGDDPPRRSFVGPEEHAGIGQSVQWVEVGAGRGALLLASEGRAGSFLVAMDGSLLHQFEHDLSSVVAVGDWDCDGADDFAVERRREIWILAGRRFEPLHSAPEPMRGVLVGSPGDLDGDGGGELVLRDGEDPISIWIASSRSDRGLVALRLPATPVLRVPHASWSRFALAAAGDLDRDGTLELALGAPRDDLVLVFSGASGAPRFVRERQSHQAGMFGYALAGGADLDHDGAPDLVVGAPGGNDGRSGVYVIPSTAALGPWRLTEGEGMDGPACVGAALCFLDDRDGDGVDDLLIGGADVRPGPGRTAPSGSVRIVSGATGKELWSYHEWFLEPREKHSR